MQRILCGPYPFCGEDARHGVALSLVYRFARFGLPFRAKR